MQGSKSGYKNCIPCTKKAEGPPRLSSPLNLFLILFLVISVLQKIRLDISFKLTVLNAYNLHNTKPYFLFHLINALS